MANKHEDDMTQGEYKEYLKREFRNGPHQHLCDFCERPWECPQITHCRRAERATCPDCLTKRLQERAIKRLHDKIAERDAKRVK